MNPAVCPFLSINTFIMISPPPLKPYDEIGIVTCAGKIEKGSLDAAIVILEGWGLKVTTGKHVYGRYNQFGGTDQERAEDLQFMLDNPGIKAILCSRGGYGTLRIIDRIDFSLFRSYPKWVVGYSDITVLHSHINQNCGIETLHALMPSELSPKRDKVLTKRSVDYLREALFGTLPAYYQSNHHLSREGKAEGLITGGNLSVLYSLLGSSSFPDTRGRILFIEDVDEYHYHIDRMMIALRRAGVLEHVAGIIVGDMTGMKDNKDPFGKTAQEIIAEAVDDFDYPVLFGFSSGHQPENHPLFLGREVSLFVGEASCSLAFK